MKATLFSPSLALLLLSAGLAHGQCTFSDSAKYAFAANAGWVDFRPFAADGVVVNEPFLTGYAYSANFGWIHFGDGSPSNGYSYSNTSNTDYGVNMDSSGRLIGYACGANVGWVALDTTTSDLLTSTLGCPDSDNDGIADAYEMRYFGNLATINFTSSPNHLYTIEHDADLQAPWTISTLGTFAPDAGATTGKTISFPSGPCRFFRVLAHKPLQP